MKTVIKNGWKYVIERAMSTPYGQKYNVTIYEENNGKWILLNKVNGIFKEDIEIDYGISL